ncbi:MAG: LacI family DNA-binding transcriptional regulator [Anaerolineaceae bacterium]
MQKRITSQDVADLAGVSRTTVSFVLNEDHRFAIRPETREKVFQAAKSLSYVPNASARALALNQSRAIGLILTRDPHYIAADTFLPQILSGLLDASKQYLFGLLVEWVEPGQQIATYHALTKARHIDGLILMTPRYDDPGLKALEESDIPSVMMGQVPGSNLYSVDIDNVAAAQMAVKHLISLGHRQIACIVNAPAPYSSATQRLEGYKSALEQAGVTYDEKLVRFADFDARSGFQQMESLLKSNQKFTAVFVASDNVAMGAMSAIREAGLSIPKDISLVGFDDVPLAAYAVPGLTTICVPAREIAQLSCHLLVRLIRGDIPESRTLTLETQLIARGSTREIGRRVN